ncbi:MAG: TIGR03619 family F420-dependent LLM class oxidoreductase [Acetobacteraceae bacterium]|nr:TIGR03619 family F420-dependent LLM class oxidoreductase [Acetobacteraceae bacterium]
MTAPLKVAIGLGLTEFPFADATEFWRWVDLCEHGGIDSLWQTDRIVSATPILECLATMAALAGRTRRLKFGVNVVSLAMRDPVLLAKQCATIDMLSEGRLLPGFGIGSPRAPEWDSLHLDTTTRGRVTDEALEILALLWTGQPVTYAGRHFKLTNAQIAPKPTQPNLPIWIGGASEAAIRRTARYGTGWQAGAETPEQLAQIVAAIRAATAAAGRTIDEDHYGAAFPFRFGTPDDPGIARAKAAYAKRTGANPDQYFAIGTAETILARIAAYIEAGAQKFILRPIGHDGAEIARQTRLLIDHVLPEAARRWPKPKRRK